MDGCSGGATTTLVCLQSALASLALALPTVLCSGSGGRHCSPGKPQHRAEEEPNGWGSGRSLMGAFQRLLT